MQLNLLELMNLDDSQTEVRHDSEEEIKLGTLRGGNSGAVIPGGKIIGSCPRKALLRLRGIGKEPIKDGRSIMFEYGRENEVVWVRKLRNVLDSLQFTIVEEGELQTSWETERGIAVTGTPDICIANKEGELLLGIELKHISSLWTAKAVTVELSPKVAHLVQSGHYMWQLGIPYKLAYTCDVDFQSPMWPNLKFPEEGEEGSEHLLYNPTGRVVKILPHRTVYDLKFSGEGKLCYRIEGREGPWTTTIISIEGIRNYYELIDRDNRSNSLPPRPSNLDALGGKTSFNLCDVKYCHLSEVCGKCGDSLADLIELI